jgi:pimeloyl-CoA synthetase
MHQFCNGAFILTIISTTQPNKNKQRGLRVIAAVVDYAKKLREVKRQNYQDTQSAAMLILCALIQYDLV